MQEIRATKVLYIKLGEGGCWEEDCITRGTLRLGYRETPHHLCAAGQWEAVRQEREARRKDKGAVTRDVSQLRSFYEEGEDVLWVTFSKNSLWWGFASPGVELLEDNSKQRSITGGWCHQDICGKPLLISQLSGQLLAVQGFQGTICSVKEAKYVIDKINGIQPHDVQAAEDALSRLEESIAVIIRRLTWKDFELLVDLIFRQAGWQRVSPVGSTMKDIDLELLSPITKKLWRNDCFWHVLSSLLPSGHRPGGPAHGQATADRRVVGAHRAAAA